MHRFIERRRGKPSYIIPILFYIMEFTLAWLVISLMEWNLFLFQWSAIGMIAMMAWIGFITYKLIRVLKRQPK